MSFWYLFIVGVVMYAVGVAGGLFVGWRHWGQR
jgi:hypothetical protein